MQIDEIKTGSWDYFSIIIELLCGIEVEGANKRVNRGIWYDLKEKGES